MRNRWFGRAILFIAALHTVGAVLIFGPVWSDVLADGLAGTILLFGDSARMSAFWFLFAGLFLGFVGGLIDWIESRELPVPAAVGWALALLTAAGIAMMPVSGFWMLLVPAVGMIIGR